MEILENCGYPKQFKLSKLDQSFYFINTKNRPQHIAAVAVFNGILDRDLVRENLFEVAKSYNRIKTTIQKDFKIKNTVISEIDLPSSYGSYMMEALPNKLWDFHVFEILETNCSHLIFKLHHALADGINGLGFFHSVLAGISAVELRKRHNELPLIATIKTIIRETISRSEKTFSKPETRGRKIYTFRIDYKYVKAVNQKLEITAPALTMYISGKISEKILGLKHNFRGLMPVALNPKLKSLALGNDIGGTSIVLKLGKNQVEALNSLTEDIDNNLNLGGYGSYFIFAKILSLLPISLSQAVASFASSKINAIVTSLSGPKSDISVGNVNLVEEYAIPALMPGQFIGFGYIKMKQALNITVVVDSVFAMNDIDIEQKVNSVLKDLELLI